MLWLILVGVFVALVYYFLTRNNDQWKKLGLPQVDPSFWVGNTPNGIMQKRNLYYDIQEVFKKFRAEYKICGLYTFLKPSILVLDPEVVRQVLLTDFNKFANNDFGDLVDKDIDPILGRNPFFINGNEWKERRGQATPAFTSARLRALYPVVESICRDLTAHIDKEIVIVGDSGLDARELTAKFTTDVVANCIFSVDSGSLKDNDAIIRRMGKEMFKPGFGVIVVSVLSSIWPRVNHFMKVTLMPSFVAEFFSKLMQDAVKQRRASGEDRGDILQYLVDLQEKKQLGNVDLTAHGISFFLDGFETTSISLAHTLYELAKDKRVQDKLRLEILDAESKAPLTMESIAELPYMEQVFYEAMRLNPVITTMTKQCTEDCEVPLTMDGKRTFKITQGTTVTIPVYDINRDPLNFKDPLKFYPERYEEFEGGLRAFKENGSLLVFGMGPRICLGMRFGLTVMKAGLVDILKRYQLSVNSKTLEPLTIDPKEFLNVPQGSIWLDIKPL